MRKKLRERKYKKYETDSVEWAFKFMIHRPKYDDRGPVLNGNSPTRTSVPPKSPVLSFVLSIGHPSPFRDEKSSNFREGRWNHEAHALFVILAAM